MQTYSEITDLVPLEDDALRQYVDARSAFTAHEQAVVEAAVVRGGMSWKTSGKAQYLIRTNTHGAQTGLGVRSPETEAMHAKFHERRSAADARLKATEQQVARAERLNKALFVGRTPQIVVDLLGRISASSVADHFQVVGTHSIYAYESAAGVRVTNGGALQTLDVDLLWDTRKIVKFTARMQLLQSTLLGLVKKVDPTFELRADQLYTARNADGFEVDVIRRDARGEDSHPLQPVTDEDEFWAVQASSGEHMLAAPRFSAVIVSANGRMARMDTIHPLAFVEVKRLIAQREDRDPLKKSRDLLQADIVERLVHERLPQWAENYRSMPAAADKPEIPRG